MSLQQVAPKIAQLHDSIILGLSLVIYCELEKCRNPQTIP